MSNCMVIEKHEIQSPPADQRTATSVRAAYRANYRLANSCWVGGENSVEVVVARTPEVVSESRTVWHRRHAWKGTNLVVKVAVSPTWSRTVEARGLAVLDGLLTTHARRVKKEGEITTLLAQHHRTFTRTEVGFLSHLRSCLTLSALNHRPPFPDPRCAHSR